MTLSRPFALAALVFCLNGSFRPSCAADYFVDVGHPKASDENPGSPDLPWKTIQHAADSALFGDTVHVAPGLYPENITIRGEFPDPKDPRARIPRGGKGILRFVADGDGPAIIEGATKLTPENLVPTDAKGVFVWRPTERLSMASAGPVPAQAMAWVFAGDDRLILRPTIVPVLKEEHVLDWRALCAGLAAGNVEGASDLLRKIWSRLSQDTQKEVQAVATSGKPTADQMTKVLGGLNGILKDRSFVSESDLASVTLPEDVGDVAKTDPRRRPTDLALWMNRRLFEALWPKALAKLEKLTREDEMCMYRESDKVLVNLNGRSVPKHLDLEVSFRPYGFSIYECDNVHIKGFVLHRQSHTGIAVNGSNCVVEDCDSIQANMYGVRAHGQNVFFRKVRVYDTNMWGCNVPGTGHRLEECVFQHVGWRREPAGEPWVGVLKFNGGSFHTVRHNLVIDRTPGVYKVGPQTVDRRGKNSFAFGGIWGDLGCMYNRVYGNAIVRIAHAGLYIEHTMNYSLIRYNTIQDCGLGIAFRQASGNVCRENWIFDSEALGIGKVDIDQFPVQNHPGETNPSWGREELDGICLWHTYITPGTFDNIITRNLVQVSGRAISIPVPTKSDERVAKEAARIMCVEDHTPLLQAIAARIDYRENAPNSCQSPLNNLLDGNYYAPSKKPRGFGFAYYLDKQIDTFEEFQKITGFEQTGKHGPFTPRDIGLQLCWTIPPMTKYDTPVAFDYDGGAERHAPPPHMAGRQFYIDTNAMPYSWYRTTGGLDDSLSGVTGLNRDTDIRVWSQWPLCRSGIRALGVSNPKNPAAIPAEGLGWRTINIPVTPKTRMRVSIHAKASNVKPVEDGKGIEIFAHFCDWTGHNVQRTWLVGGGENPSLGRGSYEWTRVEQEIKVPEGVKRMTVYAGMKAGTGTVLFDDLTMGLAKPKPPVLGTPTR